LSQKIYLDDCAYAKGLVRLLEEAGHVVVTPQQAQITGQNDEVHFRYAAGHELVLITKNPDDFLELHAADPNHAGLLVMYQDNDPSRDMNYAEIVRAIANLEKAGVEFKSQCYVLNAWRY
jgi:2,3-bisphosphoglycerate-independent phosphoglycerate mutase